MKLPSFKDINIVKKWPIRVADLLVGDFFIYWGTVKVVKSIEFGKIVAYGSGGGKKIELSTCSNEIIYQVQISIKKTPL